MNFNEAVKTELNELPTWLLSCLIKHDVCIAGGYLRDIYLKEKPKDIDIWCKSKAQAEAISDEVGGSQFRSNNSITISKEGLSVQFIHRWNYNTPYDLINSFDFTCCQAFVKITDNNYQIGYSKFFKVHCTHKALYYTEPTREEDLAGSYKRMLKFIHRGWKIDDWNSIKILNRLLLKLPTSNSLTTTNNLAYLEEQFDILKQNRGGY